MHNFQLKINASCRFMSFWFKMKYTNLLSCMNDTIDPHYFLWSSSNKQQVNGNVEEDLSNVEVKKVGFLEFLNSFVDN